MKQLTINGTSWMEYRDVLEAREDFKTYGNLRGTRDVPYSYGRLPRPWSGEYSDRRGHIDYVVLSYYTPIAWHDDERGWRVSDVKYSTTTSKSQGKILTAISQIGE